ncbi:unnamed protein product, partial [Urochloa humidicola]
QGRNGKFLLQFSTYLRGNRDETIEHLQRRHLAYYSPIGHEFFLQPFSRRTKKSVEYKKWCEYTLNFLGNFNRVYSDKEASILEKIEASVAPDSASSALAVGHPKKSKKISLILDGKKTRLASSSSSSRELNKDVPKGLASNEQKDGDGPANAPVLGNSPAIEAANTTEAVVASQKAPGKRLSSATTSQDESAAVTDPVKEAMRGEKEYESSDPKN